MELYDRTTGSSEIENMREINYDNPNKVYVAVTVRFDEAGQMRPLSIEWEDGRKFEVDRVLCASRAASLKAGGTGLRFDCRVSGKQVYLWYEDPKWFLERKG